MLVGNSSTEAAGERAKQTPCQQELSKVSSLFTLRPHQSKALEMLKDSLRSGHKRPILSLATGAGKSVIAAHIVAGALAKRKRVAFCVPALSLIDQTFEIFRKNGIDPADMGVIQGDHPWRRPAAPVQICSIQTIESRGFPEVDLIVVDEVHIRHKTIDAWIAAHPTKPFIGLSATPWSRGLKENWDDLLIPTTMVDLIEEKYLSPFKVFAPSHPDLKGIKTVDGDYEVGELSKRMNVPKLVGDVVATWLAKGNNEPTLVFAVDRAHAAAIHAKFEEAGVATAYVDAKTSREDRADLRRRFQAGQVKVICSVATMTTGVDLDVRCIILARPTKSEILFVQILGRGLRTALDKHECTILDHTDTHLNLGMVTDIHHDRLLGGKSKESGKSDSYEAKPKLPMECPKCTCLIPLGVLKCAECGFTPQRMTTAVHEAGELVEFEKKLKGKANREMTWPEKERFMGELKGYALENNYKESWAAQNYRKKVGVWPNDPRVRYAPTLLCQPATRSWIKAQIIRWSKAKTAGPKRSVDQIIADSLARIPANA
jgi:DNA repair protein RadD